MLAKGLIMFIVHTNGWAGKSTSRRISNMLLHCMWRFPRCAVFKFPWHVGIFFLNLYVSVCLLYWFYMAALSLHY